MRTAVLITINGKSSKLERFTEPDQARAAFKKLAVSNPKDVSEVQLWVSDQGQIKSKRFGPQRVAPKIEKFTRPKLPEDKPNTNDPDSFFARQQARILENKKLRSQGKPLLPLLEPESTAKPKSELLKTQEPKSKKTEKP